MRDTEEMESAAVYCHDLNTALSVLCDNLLSPCSLLYSSNSSFWILYKLAFPVLGIDLFWIFTMSKVNEGQYKMITVGEWALTSLGSHQGAIQGDIVSSLAWQEARQDHLLVNIENAAQLCISLYC